MRAQRARRLVVEGASRQRRLSDSSPWWRLIIDSMRGVEKIVRDVRVVGVGDLVRIMGWMGMDGRTFVATADDIA